MPLSKRKPNRTIHPSSPLAVFCWWDGREEMRKAHICPFALVLIALVAASTAVHAQAPPSPASSGPATRFVVVLDAAHGGSDAGGTLASQPAQQETEKAYTLALSVRLRSLLGARGIAVVTTRESDTTVDNNRRAEIANHANARHASASTPHRLDRASTSIPRH